MAKIYGNTVGASGLPKSYVLETEDGAQLIGVLVGEETVFDAIDDDVREGKIYASEMGISTGTKVIPGYLANEGAKKIRSGRKFAITLGLFDQYDYTLLQCIICRYNTNLTDSVAAEKVVLNDAVYNVLSIDPISSVVKDHESLTIDLGITNDTDETLVLKYFTYKEIY